LLIKSGHSNAENSFNFQADQIEKINFQDIQPTFPNPIDYLLNFFLSLPIEIRQSFSIIIATASFYFIEIEVSIQKFTKRS
jgi:hypothetical protein